MKRNALRYMVRRFLEIQLKVIVLISIFATGCNQWDQRSVTRLEILVKSIEEEPTKKELLEELFSGMWSEETLKAVNYIHYSAELVKENLQVRSELEKVIRKRLFSQNDWISRACAEQLPVIVEYSPTDYDVEIKQCLEESDSDVAWFALKAISMMGASGERFVVDIEDYMEKASKFQNSVGFKISKTTLQNIGTNKALSVLEHGNRNGKMEAGKMKMEKVGSGKGQDF